MMSSVTCGYLPLVDSAPLIIAKDLLFATQEGLDLTLVKQPSWSAIRDHLAFGQLDFAHLLSPMPIAMSSGQSGYPVQIDALMVLALNGTVIGVSTDMANRMAAQGWAPYFDNPRATSAAVLAGGQQTLRIGVPFPFSMHRLLVDYWLRQDPAFANDRVEIISVPPPQMSQALRNGRIDMFCVGEPWGSVAVQDSGAVLVLPTSAIWNCVPEKVLGARRDWVTQNPATCHAMVRAVYRAARWLEQPQNVPLAVEILASSKHLDLPDHAIEPALTGQIRPRSGADPLRVDRFMVFHNGAANFPWRSQASWISAQLGVPDQSQCFRSDIYRDALTPIGVDIPNASAKVEGVLSEETPVTNPKGALILAPDNFYDGAAFDIATETTPKE
jgi:NitT/TauT family transport system ATP-binding protein